TTPSARNKVASRYLYATAQPPLLCEEGNDTRTQFISHMTLAFRLHTIVSNDMMRFSELFLAEHELIHRAVAVLERMTAKADAGIYADRHDINALLIFLHYFVDACHQTKEESILFPTLRQAQTPVQSSQSPASVVGEIEDLLREHVEDRFLIERSQL